MAPAPKKTSAPKKAPPPKKTPGPKKTTAPTTASAATTTTPKKAADPARATASAKATAPQKPAAPRKAAAKPKKPEKIDRSVETVEEDLNGSNLDKPKDTDDTAVDLTEQTSEPDAAEGASKGDSEEATIEQNGKADAENDETEQNDKPDVDEGEQNGQPDIDEAEHNNEGNGDNGDNGAGDEDDREADGVDNSVPNRATEATSKSKGKRKVEEADSDDDSGSGSNKKRKLERVGKIPMELKLDTLYDKCLEEPVGTFFSSGHLSGFGIAENMHEVVELIQKLVRQQKLIVLRNGNTTGWKTRDREQASKLRKLTNDQLMVYGYIEASETQGIWRQVLGRRSGLHEAVLKRSIDVLEKKGLIKQIKSAKRANQKVYMLSHLNPSDDVTGGSWFEDGDMDSNLVESVFDAICLVVRGQSWAEQGPKVFQPPGPKLNKGNRKRKHSDVEDSDDETPDAKRRRDEETPEEIQKAKEAEEELSATLNDIATSNETLDALYDDPLPEPPKYTPAISDRGYNSIPKPAGARGYPTTASILPEVVDLLYGEKATNVSESDLQVLMDALVFDGRLERIGEGYRTTRQVGFRDNENKGMGKMGNAYTESPCGRCPVFDLCEARGSMISATKCEYYTDWLDF